MNRDIYEYLLDFADDETIINMLSVNKKFNDEKLFERVIKKKYPYLAIWKSDDITWKEYYVRQVHYMSLLNKKYDIPFISLKGYNPEYLYKELVNKWNDKNEVKQEALNHILFLAAGDGDLNIVKYIIEKGVGGQYIFLQTLENAAQNGHLHIVKFLTEKGYTFNPYQIGSPLGKAAENGHIEVVKYLIKIGNNYENYVLIQAAKGGHKDIINLAVKHGATGFESAIKNAKDSDTVEYLQKFT